MRTIEKLGSYYLLKQDGEEWPIGRFKRKRDALSVKECLDDGNLESGYSICQSRAKSWNEWYFPLSSAKVEGYNLIASTPSERHFINDNGQLVRLYSSFCHCWSNRHKYNCPTRLSHSENPAFNCYLYPKDDCIAILEAGQEVPLYTKKQIRELFAKETN